MPNQYEQAFNAGKKILGMNFGQPCQILSVNYTAVDQTPTQKYARKMYKVETTGARLVQTPLPNGAWYTIIGDYNAVVAGDILVPLRSDSNTPVVTMISRSPFEEQTGFRTSRVGDIMNGEEVLFSDCYFEYATTTNYPGDPIHFKMVISDGVPEQTIIMYRRDLRTTTYDTEGLLLKETSSTPNVYWKIKQTTEIGELMALTCSLSVYE